MRLTSRRADRFRVIAVVLLRANERFHILRANQLDLMPQRLELARPIECARASFDNDHAAIDLPDHSQQFVAHHAALENNPPIAVDAVKLKHVLGDVHAESLDRHLSLLPV